MNNMLTNFNTTLNNEYLYVLLFFIIFDFITGTLKAFSNSTLNSKTNKKGITNHVTIFLFCSFFTWVFSEFNVAEYSNILIMFYIVSYGVSIIENMGAMGLPLPKWLADKFKMLQDETNKGVENDEIKRDK